jgi:hypothetical protein
MTAQILSAIAFCMSWIWWVTFLLSAPLMFMLQAVWCCRMKKGGLRAAGILSTLSALGSLFAGIWILIKWKNEKWCEVFVLTNDDYDADYYYDYYNYDNCREVAWAVVAFINFALFAVAAHCLFHFVHYRFDKVLAAAGEEQEDESDTAAIAMVDVSPITTTATAPPMYIDDIPSVTAIYVQPEVLEKERMRQV